MVANDDPALAIVELERAKKLGHVGIMIPTVAGEGVPQYHERGMDPLWEAAVANDMSVNIHAGTARERHTKTSLIQVRSEEHTSELQSLLRTSYAVFCMKKNKHHQNST